MHTKSFDEPTVTLTDGPGWRVFVESGDCCASVSDARAAEIGLYGSLPPSVIRGEKPHPDVTPPPPSSRTWHVESVLDWLRMTAPGFVATEILAWARHRFGEPTEERGFSFYRNAHVFPGGLVVLTGHSTGDSVMVELGGDALSIHDPEARRDLARDLVTLGFTCTRLDVAQDFKGDHVDLVERVEQWCRGGHLCGAKSWAPVHTFNARGDRKQSMVTIGGRGSSGSGRYVRCYDKGLELKGPPNIHHRWEAEFSGDCAHAVLLDLINDYLPGEWHVRAAERALGAVDFRAGDVHQTLDRRPRLSFWAGLLDGLAVRIVRAKRSFTTGAAKLTWLRRTVMPTLMGIADQADVHLLDLFRELTSGVSDLNARRAYNRPSVMEAAELVHDVVHSRRRCSPSAA